MADEQDVQPGPASPARALGFETKIENSRRTFTAELNAAALSLSPEERAIRIERWQQEQAPLLQQAKAARTAPIQTAPDVSTPNSANSVLASPASFERSKNPIHAEILEIETGIRDFQKSLAIQKLTPEQRALQIEQFHQLNCETLKHLETLERQSAAQFREADVPEAPASALSMPPEVARLKAEIDRVMQDLAETDPETRAQYLETHAATLKAMMENLDSGTEDQSHSPSP